MTACPCCASESPEGARFCPSCGAALAAPAAHAVERRIVTTMFCDLVDFTGLCEATDSEDVDRLLREFYALARSAIEIYGGVVEKFVGDAVVGIFGVPAAHEDEAERAVLTALRLRERIADLPQIAGRSAQLRIGINTGAATVRLDVQPGSGEGFLVGDAVNTAARLQQLAPPMGIVVGAKTRELSARTIDYARFDSAAVKDKRAAVKCWLVRGRISRMGVDLRQQFRAALVGREVELAVLRGLLKKVRVSGQPQFALVTGEPGIGKSRLVFELLRYVDSRPAIVRWRQGRCPAYGDGLTFWALGEIVREQLGVLEGDESATVEAKLAHALAGTDEAEWLAARLRPLLGLESPGASREENFAAWQRFLELIATDAPAVVVFEDLHWASEGALAFLRHLSENLSGVPLLAVGTTRPELLQAQPDLAARLAEMAASQRGTLLDLGPLSEAESAELVSRVGPALSELRETCQAIIGRCGGNPLFAEQLVCLLEEEEQEEADEKSSPGTQPATDVALKDRAARALPESLQSLIAARLDGLPPARKALLGDAAVVGEVFWTGAVAALDHGDRTTAEEGLQDLAQRDYVRPSRDSSLAGENEFAFRHALIRDVAYAQLTRADRAVKHAAVARWIETTGARREAAEIATHHYLFALELARAADDPLARELVQPTIASLRGAADLVVHLDVAQAEQYLARAVSLTESATPGRAGLLMEWGEALYQCGRYQEATRVLEEAVSGLLKEGDRRTAATALTRLAWVASSTDNKGASRYSREALSLLEGEPVDAPSPELVEVLEQWARECLRVFDRYAAIKTAERAMSMSEGLGLPLPVRALEYRAVARCQLGDAAGLDDFRLALREARAQALAREIGPLYHNLAGFLTVMEGAEPALEAYREGLAFAQKRRDRSATGYLSGGIVEALALAGQWESATIEAESTDRLLNEAGEVLFLQHVRATYALLLVWRGDVSKAEPLAAWALEANRQTAADELQTVCLLALAAVEAARGRPASALRWLEEYGAQGPTHGMSDYVIRLPEALRIAVRAGEPDLAARLVRDVPRSWKYAVCAVVGGKALLQEANDEPAAADTYAAAAAGWRALGIPYEEAQSDLARGRCLVAIGRTDDALHPLTRARQVFANLAAAPAMAETEAVYNVALSAQSPLAEQGNSG